jgi:hypothetical protein
MVVAPSGVEPEHPFEYQILSLARLPIPPRGREQFHKTCTKTARTHAEEDIPLAPKSSASANSATFAQNG